MAKAPRLGRVKTRLGREIGAVEALRCYRTLLRHTLLRLGRDARWQTIVAATPDPSSYERWAGRLAVMPQGRGDLGQRMFRLLRGMPFIGARPIILVGCDIPGLRPGHLADAFRLLSASDAVLGPAEDGGYWLVGARRAARMQGLFDGVRWSGPHALDDTRRNLAGRRLAMAVTLADLDTIGDYLRLRAVAGRLISPPRARSPAADAPQAAA